MSIKVTQNFIRFLDAIPYLLNRLSKADKGTGVALEVLSILSHFMIGINFSKLALAACSPSFL